MWIIDISKAIESRQLKHIAKGLSLLLGKNIHWIVYFYRNITIIKRDCQITQTVLDAAGSVVMKLYFTMRISTWLNKRSILLNICPTVAGGHKPCQKLCYKYGKWQRKCRRNLSMGSELLDITHTHFIITLIWNNFCLIKYTTDNWYYYF